jgi:hypothetical protein
MHNAVLLHIDDAQFDREKNDKQAQIQRLQDLSSAYERCLNRAPRKRYVVVVGWGALVKRDHPAV